MTESTEQKVLFTTAQRFLDVYKDPLDTSKAKEEYETLKSDEAEELRGLPPRGEKRTNTIQRYKGKKHKQFIKYCLDPSGFKHRRNEVYVHIGEIATIFDEAGTEFKQVQFSLVTPLMAYTDYAYFNGISKEMWWHDEYRPYYYEFITRMEAVDERLSNIIENKGKWLRSKLKRKAKTDKDYEGTLFFGGSAGTSDPAILEAIDSTLVDSNCKTLEKLYANPGTTPGIPLRCFLAWNIRCSKQGEVRVLNVGEANCVHVKDDSLGTAFFVDIGIPLERYDDIITGKKNVYNPDMMSNSGICQSIRDISNYSANCIFITHWHFDHTNAFSYLKNEGLNSTWIVPEVTDETPITANRVLFYKETVSKTDNYIINGAGLIFDNKNPANRVQIWRSTKKTADYNDSSLILRIDDKLFPGDCLYEFWPDGLQNELSGITKLVVPHHGTSFQGKGKNKKNNTDVLDKFDKSKPKTAIVSVGCNGYGHPSQKNHLDLLANQGFDVIKTEDDTSRHYYNL